MVKLRVFVLCVVSCSLCACSKSTPDVRETTHEAEETNTSAVPDKSHAGGVISPRQNRALEQAKSVENLLMEAEQRRRQQMP